MQEQTITIESPSNDNGRAAPKSTTDSLIDSALDFLSSEQSDRPTRPGPTKQPRAEPREPDGDEAEEQVEKADVPELDDEQREEEPAQDDGEEEPHDARGSKEDPFTVKDLPADKFIEIKVDGEKTVISLDELAKGYIGQKTVNQRLNKTKLMADEAQSAIAKAKEVQDRVKEEFRAFIGDPEQIYDFFLGSEEREQVFEQAAMKYAALRKRFRENPEERLQWQRERDRQRLQAERDHWQAQKDAEAAERQRTEAHQRAMAIFKPGWEAGLKKAGFPTPTPALWEEVMVRCNQRVQSGAVVTSDDVAEFVHRACKLLELLPHGAKRPKPAPVSSTPRAPAATRKRDAWAGKSAAERRRDPDYFLKSLRPSDFR